MECGIGSNEIRSILKYTWTTFFCRFGFLRPIQIKSIPLILEKKDLILISPTATGKTEAVLAPLIERLLIEKWQKLSILYVSPTRALVNDIFFKFNPQIEELSLKMDIKTGDKPYFSKVNIPNILVTTPESLDSLICRKPEIFRNIKAIIMDELHLLDNTFRGDQLRILIRRLEKLADTQFHRYSMSATIVDPIGIGKRYFKNFKIVKDVGQKDIEWTIVDSVEDVFNYCCKENLKKILIFCNSRCKVEQVGKECSKFWGGENVAIHHGSLSKNVREETELFMKEGQSGVCVATPTLEIGIDIGDIDAIVLGECPLSISSMIQRIGRGNRKAKKNRVFAVYTTDDEKIMYEKMFRQIMSGNIPKIEYKPDLSVVVQQIFSILFANPSGVPTDYFEEIFKDFCSKDDLYNIIRHLNKEGHLIFEHEKWICSEEIMNMGEKGRIHSNIPDNSSYKVFDVVSKRIIGEISSSVDKTFILSGRSWQVIEKDSISSKIYVKPYNLIANEPEFQPHNQVGAFARFLPPNLEKKNV